MALSQNLVWEVQTGGSDTANGGGFDASVTGGMFADGAATLADTAAPVFTSASYTFVAGDVGAWVYIATTSGGWYGSFHKIVSVAAGAATLEGTIGLAVQKTTYIPTTVVGCASVASPSSATWTIDYSQQAAARHSYTDLASSGAGLTVTSAATPFTKRHVGNVLVVASGTNFNAGRYVIASISGVTATVTGAGNITSGVGSAGVGGLGGAFASPGASVAPALANHRFFVKSGTYSITSASTNIAGGCLLPGFVCWWEGYQTTRGGKGTRPLLQASGISTATIVGITTSDSGCSNMSVDGAGLTAIRGFSSGAARATMVDCSALNCTNAAFVSTGLGRFVRCSATGCSAVTAFTVGSALCVDCEAFDNTFHGFSGGSALIRCIADSNTGATTDGFTNATNTEYINCVAYANGRDGFGGTASTAILFLNCIAEANVAIGFRANTAVVANAVLLSCAVFNNGTPTSGVFSDGLPVITLTASPFVDAANGNFGLNTTAGGGTVCRSAGKPVTFLRGLTASVPDIGAAQHADPTPPVGQALIATRASTY